MVGTPNEAERIFGEIVGARLDESAYAIPGMRQQPEGPTPLGKVDALASPRPPRPIELQ